MAGLTVMWLLVAGAVAGVPAFAEEACTGNAIACENRAGGADATEWDDTYGGGDWEIQSFTTDISVNVGQAVDFKI